MTFDADAPDPSLAPGFALARGVCRAMADLGWAPMVEFAPARGLRADVFAVGPKGEVWIVECKSGPADYRSDRKWPGYLDWCDRFHFAVDATFPTDLLPPDEGLILADAWGAEVLREGPERTLAPARRKALLLRAGRAAALRLRGALDPGAPALSDC